MKNKKNLKMASQAFILLSSLGLSSVVLMAFFNPQSVMDLVKVKLTNTDAFSSIRGIYGGVGLAITISLLYLMIKDTKKGIAFLCMFWGGYALSRIITIFAEGTLGSFGRQWLAIEGILFIISLALLLANRNGKSSLTTHQ